MKTFKDYERNSGLEPELKKKAEPKKKAEALPPAAKEKAEPKPPPVTKVEPKKVDSPPVVPEPPRTEQLIPSNAEEAGRRF